VRYLYAIVALGLLIAFHELGHLLAARLFKIRVLRYSIGFGPAILSFRRGGIEWVLGALPLGGYVQVYGMNPHEGPQVKTDPASFAAKPAWKRMVVLAAGSFGNYLLALGLLVGLYMAGTHVPVHLTVGTVEPGSEAARAQLRPGDLIAQVDGRPLRRWMELATNVAESAERPLVLEVHRGEERLQVTVVPRKDSRGAGRIGVAQQYVFREHRWDEALPAAFDYTNRLFTEGLAMLGRLLRGSPGVELASPVLIVKAASDAASSGWDAFLRVMVSISVALALFNLLPIPALDGGRLLFVAIEAVTGRPVNPKVETLLHTAGFFLLIALIIHVAFGDVRKLLRAPEAPGPAASSGTVDAGAQPE
jgi:regulator of sigma E protease